MGTAHAVSLLLAGSASAAGIVIVGVMWRRQLRRARARLTHHPSTRPPISVRIEGSGEARRWQIDVRPGAPTVAIDILSYRPAAQDATWSSEPIVEPIVIEPGTTGIMPSAIVDEAERFEVVVAWTARHESGDVQDSRLFEVPEPARPLRRQPDSTRAAVPLRPASALAALLAASVAVVGFSAAGTGDDGGQTLPLPTTTAVELPSTGGDATAESTTPSGSPTDLTATAGFDPVPSTSPPSAETTPTVPSSPTERPAATSTVASSPTAVADATISITGTIGPCRFGTDCLIASFTIDGFDGRPQEYVCEFEDGSRFSFRFDSQGVEGACATGSTTAEITVEVAGVRSDTLTRANV